MDFHDTAAVFRHLSTAELQRAYRMMQLFQRRRVTLAASGFLNSALRLGLPIAGLLRGTAFANFCAGETLDEALGAAQRLNTAGIAVILDYAVEEEKGPSAFEAVTQEVIAAIQASADLGGNTYFAIKLSALADLGFAAKSGHYGVEVAPGLVGRVDRILDAAASSEVRVLIDAEQTSVQARIDQLAEDAMACYNRDRCVVYTTIQLYRKDRLDYLQALLARARGRHKLGLKLVRGAYLEEERRIAAAAGLDSPILDSKQQVDEAFNRAVDLCLTAGPDVNVCIATHNEESCRLAARHLLDASVRSDGSAAFFAQLLGMADHITYTLRHHGLPTAKYLPFGPIRKVIPYLARRAEENSSVFGHAAKECQLLLSELRRRKRFGHAVHL